MTDERQTSRKARTSKRKHRRGLRLIELWVPDVRSQEFAAEAHRQSLAIAQGEFEAEDQAFIDSISEWPVR